MQLLVTNPGKKRGRRTRRRSRMRRAARKVFATMKKSRRRRSRRSGGPKAFRRRSRRGFAAVGALMGGSFSIKGAAIQGVVAGAGAIGVNMLINKVAAWLPASLTSGTGRAVAKAALGIGLGIAARKFGLGKYAAALAMGGVAVAVLDIYTSKVAGGGVHGIDYFDADGGVNGLGEMVQAPDGSIFDAAGNLIYSPALAA
jgi:hypothetical protein